MRRSALNTILVLVMILSWFGGVVFFYDYDKDNYQMTHRANQDQTAINMLQKYEINIEEPDMSSVSVLSHSKLFE